MKKKLLIKVCGMRQPQNINAVAGLSIDILGFIFAPESPRHVEPVSSLAGIIPDLPAFNTANVKKRVKLAGVFVDGMPQNIVTAVYNYHLDFVQLHGHETPVMVDNLKRTLVPDISPDIKIIKALNIGEAADLEQCAQYEGLVDYFLFDTKASKAGGNGTKFDWSVLEAYHGTTPFFLSGGIKPGDADKVTGFCHPMLVGIDLNSGFETEPGIKDVDKLRTFVEQIREAEK